MIQQLVFACTMAMSLVLYIAQHDPWFTGHVMNHFAHTFETSLNCKLSADLQYFSFAGSLKLKNMLVKPVHGSAWYWSAQTFDIEVSWIELLLYGTLDFSIIMHDPKLHSLIEDNQLAIKQHLDLIFNGPQLETYTFLKTIEAHNAQCTLIDEQSKGHIKISFDGNITKKDNLLRFALDVFEGSLCAQDRMLCNNMSGALQLDSFGGQPTLDICLKGAASFEIPQLGTSATPCTISGSWHHSGGVLSIKNLDHSFAIDPIMIQNKGDRLEINLDAKVPLGYAWRMFTNNNMDDRLSGQALIQSKTTINADTCKSTGHLMMQRMHWQNYELGSLAKISFNAHQHLWQGTLYVQRTSGACIAGKWNWDQKTGSGDTSIKNNARLTLSPKHDWQILPDDFTLDAHIHDYNNATITHHAKATHTKILHQLACQGTVTCDNASITAEGTFDTNNYSCKLMYQPEWQLQHITYSKEDGTTLAQLHQENEGIYNGSLSLLCIKDILKRKYDYNLQGEGMFTIRLETGDLWKAHIGLQQGAIRLPHTYNFINGFNAHLLVDFAQKQCTLNDFSCNLHSGMLSSKKMVFQLSDTMNIHTLYAPIVMEHCLINMGKELFAVVSGDILLHNTIGSNLQLDGKILIERSQLKANIFSDVFQQKLRNHTARSFETSDNKLLCNLTVKTKNPVRVQTPFLDTDARIDLHIRNKISDPEVLGTISLNGGKLLFPYKPLYITSGALHFIPGQLDDPIIELYAKNNIKKNNISLHATGSLQNQHVRLESSPTLTEEQIISLLLVGSQEESLNMVMPALIMQNVKSVIFGYDQSESNISRYFNTLFKPFGRIRLVPSFIDQSGRGGLRGAIEWEISDRWRAVIQKNFSLTEDTNFEIEYMISDDISARFTRDIRRDLILEAEMRYKFGNS